MLPAKKEMLLDFVCSSLLQHLPVFITSSVLLGLFFPFLGFYLLHLFLCLAFVLLDCLQELPCVIARHLFRPFLLFGALLLIRRVLGALLLLILLLVLLILLVLLLILIPVVLVLLFVLNHFLYHGQIIPCLVIVRVQPQRHLVCLHRGLQFFLLQHRVSDIMPSRGSRHRVFLLQRYKMLVLFYRAAPLFLSVQGVSQVKGGLFGSGVLFQGRSKPVRGFRVFLLLVLLVAFADILPRLLLPEERDGERGAQ